MLGSLSDNRLQIIFFLGRALKHGWALVPRAVWCVCFPRWVAASLLRRQRRACAADLETEHTRRMHAQECARVTHGGGGIQVAGMTLLRDWEVFLSDPRVTFVCTNQSHSVDGGGSKCPQVRDAA